jgi:Rieske 2Fe-2S family protein|tara:strand:+ start:8777 stop:9862 length:1086 start_codon:yes stop_codon:yes gene_type:complete
MEKTLHKDHYTQSNWFTEEINHIFHNEWVCVGSEQDLRENGDYKIIDFYGESIILLRDNDGQLNAFINLCKHRGCELLDTQGSDLSGHLKNKIRCPYHSWTYNLKGHLINAPHLDIDLNDTKFHLNNVKLQTWIGFIFLNLNPDALDLKQHLESKIEQFSRYPLEQLIPKVHIPYEIKANWKVLLENYNECYHCAGVHPELCNIVPAFRKDGGANLEWEEGVPHREGANTFTLSGVTNRKPFPGLNDLEKERHFGQALYPNFLISLSMDHVAIFILHPISESTTKLDFYILFHPDSINDDEFDPSDAEDFWSLTNKQDWKICEKVQRGMQSKTFSKGYYGKMEDENLDIRKYISEKLNINI